MNKLRRSKTGVSTSFIMDEDKIIEEFTMTVSERIIRVCKLAKDKILTFDPSSNLVEELEWSVSKLKSGEDLYSYEDTSSKYSGLVKNNAKFAQLMKLIRSFNELQENTENNQISIERLGRRKISSEERKEAELGKEIRESASSFIKTQKMVKTVVRKESTKNSNKSTDKLAKIVKEIKKSKTQDNMAKMLKKQSESEGELQLEENLDLLEEERLDSVEFNIFDFAEDNGPHNIAYILMNTILSRYDIERSPKLHSFCLKVSQNYSAAVPYHTVIHGCDVTQTVFAWFVSAQIEQRLLLNRLDLLSFFVAALLHDVGHPGLNNSFQVNQLTDLAMTHNDKSVLENSHITLGFKILTAEDSAILEGYSRNDFHYIRKRIIELILATDMAEHSKNLSSFRSKVCGEEKLVDGASPKLFNEQQEFLNFLLHCGDISHNSKYWGISRKWADLVYEEFFAQGDLERKRGTKVSFLCDRETVNVRESQIGFIKAIIVPTFDTLVNAFKELNFLAKNISNNLENWEEEE